MAHVWLSGPLAAARKERSSSSHTDSTSALMVYDGEVNGGAEEAEVGEHRQLRRQRPHEVVGEELKLGHATISAHTTHCQLQWVAAAQPAFS